MIAHIKKAALKTTLALTIITAPATLPAQKQTTSTTPTKPGEQPNIVFLISDDHRWDCIGIAGNDKVQTPHLDRMAREGQWYREFTIQIPSCSPSRAAMLTGLAPAQNGWYSNEYQRQDILNPNGFDQYSLLPRELAKAGYHTAFTGKWHLTPDPWNCGFESIQRWMLGGAGPFRGPHLAQGRSRQVKHVPGFTQTIFADDAIYELRRRADNTTSQPLFLWVAFTAPHGPFTPNPPPFDGMYKGQRPRDLAPDTFYDNPALTRRGRQTWPNYYESITALDHEVGRILNTIRTHDTLSSNTLVIFMGDNGFMMGRRQLGGKYLPYDDALRVPMIAWGPGVLGTSGTTVTAALNSLDLPPTWIELANAKIPETWAGRSFTKVLADGKTHDFTASVSSYPDHQSLLPHVKAYRVIRTPTHKLITWHPNANQTPELYDLINDPAENKNLYNDPSMAEIQKELETKLTQHRQRIGDTEWDMKGPFGMFEPERLTWTYEEGPQDPTKNSDNKDQE